MEEEERASVFKGCPRLENATKGRLERHTVYFCRGSEGAECLQGLRDIGVGAIHISVFLSRRESVR